MTDAEFEKYSRLVPHIIHEHFSWVFSRARDGEYRHFRRHIDFDDLVQEGYVAMMESWQRYTTKHTSRAKFTTFAGPRIYGKVAEFINDNISPIRVVRWDKQLKVADQDEKDRISSMIFCRLFSEGEYLTDSCAEEFIEDPSGEKWMEEVERVDNMERILTKLHRYLGKKDFELLSDYLAGDSFSRIAIRRGVSKETVRKRFKEICVKAWSIFPNSKGGGQ